MHWRALAASATTAVALAAAATTAVALAAAATTAASASSSNCANANRRVTPDDTAAMRAAVLCLVNQQRTSRHLPPLHASARLTRSAQGWTNHMVASNTFAHGANFAARITAVGYPWSAAGENIATGFPTPRAVVTGWMRSTDHCRNILSPAYRNLGVGVSARAVRGYASGPATWTQDFALPRGAHPPSHNLGPANGCPTKT
jgi:uncharacterized protein YkwD